MSFKREVILSNFGVDIPHKIYTCDECGEEIDSSNPYSCPEKNIHYCLDCSFKKDLVNERQYLDLSGVCLDKARVLIKDENVIIVIGKAPWEISNKDIRSSKKYSEWRTAVFERDGYTCQHCSDVGGVLNAHHIKPFATYPLLRFELSNGITLCYECHKAVHKKR